MKLGKSHTAGWASDSPTPAQLKELFAQIESGRVTRKSLQGFLRGGTEGILRGWEDFYSDLFGIEIDLSSVKVPKKRKGFDRLIVVAQGVTPQRAYDKCSELFPSRNWTGEDLDEVESERTSKDGHYAVWFRDRVEADEELKDLSDDLKERDVPVITLEERFIYELKYFRETGEHLDRRSFTLCLGSRDSCGGVPRVGWCGGGFRVGWSSPDSRRGARLRARQAVL